jgi:hypothetical protein
MTLLTKKTTLMLIFSLTVLSTLLIEPCVAPITIPNKPKEGPEVVSVVIHNAPIWSPPVTNTNPYTGEVLSTQPGYSYHNGTLEMTIKNRPFTPYTDTNGNTINTYYCIFYSLPNDFYSGWRGYQHFSYDDSATLPFTVYQSDSDFTTIIFKYFVTVKPDNYGSFDGGFSFHGVVSFRIQTVEEGYFIRGKAYEGVGSAWTEFTITMPSHDPFKEKNPFGTFKPNIKPITVAPSTSNPNSLPTSEPARPPPSEPWTTYLLIIIIATVCITPLVIVAYRYSQRKPKPIRTIVV